MTDERSGRANASFLLGHALVWAAAMIGAALIFKNEPWMKTAIPFLALAFVLVNGVRVCALRRRES